MPFERILLSPTADFHVHLREGDLMKAVIPSIRQGGSNIAYVMPNLKVPIISVPAAITYRDQLQKLAPDVTFLMTLYLHPSITPRTVEEAAKAGISGVKAYPAGVTTNSEAGVLDWKQYYPVFEAMQKFNLVLNLHGEVPALSSTDAEGVSIMNAEDKFLPTLLRLHEDFPSLRIVLEHCTTRRALEAVLQCGQSVGCTITAHHLFLTIDDVCGDVFNFCKPVAKTMVDRMALVKAIVSGNKKVFFGSDSAPHTLEAKKDGKKAPAGCFTQGWTTQLVVAAVEEGLKNRWIDESNALFENLRGFLSEYGRAFYNLPQHDKRERIVLKRKGERIPEMITNEEKTITVVPFKAGDEVMSLEWVDGEVET